MEQLTILILSMTFGLLIYSLIAKWYVVPYLISMPRSEAFVPILLFHCFRYIGLSFLIPGIVSSDLSPLFSQPAAYGDLLTAVLALVALMALRNRWSFAVALVWIFNIVGTLDFFSAIYLGIRYASPSLMGPTYFIPVIIVPAMLVGHYIIFKLLLRGEAKV